MPLTFELGDFDPGADFEGEHPAGENLRHSDDGRAIRASLRDMREEARRIERKADEGDVDEGGWPAARSLWKEVRDQSLDVLKYRSHDLEIASFCIEALARTDGFIGLTMGFEMVREMVERQWASVYPVPDPEDGPADEAMVAEEKILPIQRLVGLDSEGLLLPALLHIPLTVSRDGEEFGLCHWRSSRELVGESNEEKLALAVERGATSPKQFEDAVQATSQAFLMETFGELQEAAASWESLSDAVASCSGGLAVLPAGPLRDLFEECRAAFQSFAPSVTAEDGGAEEAGEEAAAEPGASAEGDPAAAGGRIRTRADAFAQLEKIASFFEANDPHSLIAAHLRTVVRLGRLSREEYYRQLLKDAAAVDLLFNAVGMQQPEQEGGGY